MFNRFDIPSIPISLPLLTEDDLSENELLCELKQYMEAVYSGDCIL